MKSSQVFQGGAGEKAGVRPGYVFQTLQGAGLKEGIPLGGFWGVGKDGSDIWHQWSGHPVKLLGARWFGYMLASTLLEMATSFIQPSHGMISWCSTHFLCPSWWLQSRSSLIRKWCLWHLKVEGADQGGGALWSDLRKFSSTRYGDLWDPALFFFLRWGNWQHRCDVVEWYKNVEDCLF